MHKIFKYLTGTTGGGGIPWANTSNSSALSIMFTLPPMPNYRVAAQASNSSVYTPKLSSTLINNMITTPSVNPTSTPSSGPNLIGPGITDVTPNGYIRGGTSLLAGTAETTVNGTASVGNTLGTIVDIGSMIVPKKPQSGLTSGLDTGYDAASSAVMNVNPLIGGIMKAGGLAVDTMRAFGVGTDLVTTEDLILDSKLLALTPFGLINAFGAKKGQTINKGLDYNAVKADMSTGYGDVMDRLATAEKYSGKKMGNLFGQRDRANRKVYEGNYQLAQLERIWDRQSIDRALQGTQSDMLFNKENLRMKGGWQDGSVSFGRSGMIIEPARLRMIRRIALSYKPLVYTETELSEEEVVKFKNGGSFNVIPEGSLHARLHHMENADGLTKKGIPVVAEKEGGEIEQQAEIELNEIIFRLEVTNKIEKLMKDGSDNAAIECGKMLVKEIFENTQDRTGLIESLEEPKKELEDVVKEHRVFQDGGTVKPNFDDWFKTIPGDRNDTTLYNLRRAYELEKWELLEKWRNATPEQLKNDTSYHLKTFYFNPEGIGEFVKHRNHPTIKGELDFYFGDDGKDFREQYYLDTSGDYYKYVPRK